MDSPHSWIRTRLSAMMFLEFFLWSAWFIPITGYMAKTLQFKGSEIGWIISTAALGAIIAPLFVGYVADRLFSTERVISVLHLIGGICLCLAAEQKEFGPLMTLMMINGLCFMPTLALCNSLAFRNIPDPDKFPRIVVWGTIGWIVAGLTVGIVLGGTEKWFFYLGGGGGIVMSLYSLTLPHTPPKGREEAGGDVLGFGAIGLLKDRAFLVFAVCAFLISIPTTVFFVGCNPMLVETGRPAPTALMTLCQFSEILVMFTMPWFIAWLGLNRVLALGMGAWAVRYVLFGTLSFPLILVGLLLHGFCYSFVFVGAYIYVDKRAPRDMRASAQSFISFLMLGVGMFIGAKLGGYTMDRYPALVTTMPATVETEKGPESIANAPLPPWADPEAGESAWRFLDLSSTIKGWLSGEKAEAAPDLGEKLDGNTDGQITLAELEQIPDEGLQFGERVYSRKDLTDVFTKIAGEVEPGTEISVGRLDWLAAQSHQWPPIWYWPAGMAALICLFFWFGSRDTEPAKEEEIAN